MHSFRLPFGPAGNFSLSGQRKVTKRKAIPRRSNPIVALLSGFSDSPSWRGGKRRTSLSAALRVWWVRGSGSVVKQGPNSRRHPRIGGDPASDPPGINPERSRRISPGCARNRKPLPRQATTPDPRLRGDDGDKARRRKPPSPFTEPSDPADGRIQAIRQ